MSQMAATLSTACRGMIAAAFVLFAPCAAATAQALPALVRAALPAGHVVRESKCSRGFDPPHLLCIVVAVRRDEGPLHPSSGKAPPRPLLVYRVTTGRAALVDRNDHVVLRRDEGGQCDPFDADVRGIAVTGRSFTIESGVACGQHWTDFVTFRFDPRQRAFLWRSEIVEQWRMGDDPNGDALVRDGGDVRRADPRNPIRLGNYRSRRD